jgi:hypothetical protein
MELGMIAADEESGRQDDRHAGPQASPRPRTLHRACQRRRRWIPDDGGFHGLNADRPVPSTRG